MTSSTSIPVEEKISDLPATLAPETLSTIPLDSPEEEVISKSTSGANNNDSTLPRKPDVYDRFSSRKKKAILCIVAMAAFLGPITGACFLPSIPQIAKDTNSTPSIINYTVAIFIVMIGLAPLAWAPLAGFYGRRPVYLTSIPIFIASSIGVALSKTVSQLIGTRILQAIGSSAVLAVGAGSVGDIYRPQERANAMSWFYSGVVLGPALSPCLAGVFQEYTSQTWRSMQYCLAGFGLLSFVLVLFWLPETTHGGTPHALLCKERGVKFVPYWFNPLKAVLLLRWPNIALISLNSSCVLLSTYAVLVPLGTILGARYNITNSAILGTLYLSYGLGQIIGSRIAGPYADYTVRKWTERRGYRRIEDRLYSTLWGGAVIGPLSLIPYGWLVQTGKGGLAPPLVLLVINGISLMVCLNPANVYAVDSMQQRSAEVIAINNFCRYIFAAAASAGVLPLSNAIGIGWTNTLAAFIQYIGLACVLITIKWGTKWREDANAKNGNTYKEADEVVPVIGGGVVKDEEAVVGMPRSNRTTAASEEDHDHDHDHGEEHENDVGEMIQDLRRMRTTALTQQRNQLPDSSMLLSRSHSLTEGHH